MSGWKNLGLPCTPRKIWQGHQGFMKPRSASSSVSPRNRLILVTLPCSNCDLSTNAGLDFRVLEPNPWANSVLCSWNSTRHILEVLQSLAFSVYYVLSLSRDGFLCFWARSQAHLGPQVFREEEFRKKTESLYPKPKLVTLVMLSIVSFLPGTHPRTSY